MGRWSRKGDTRDVFYRCVVSVLKKKAWTLEEVVNNTEINEMAIFDNQSDAQATADHLNQLRMAASSSRTGASPA